MVANPSPFTLQIPQADLVDLKARISRSRLPDEAPEAAWRYGTSVDYMRDLLEYWQHDFDWRDQEAALNSFPQFRVPLHGIDLHFLHVQGEGPAATPLLLSHGWPGSVFEFLDLIPRLTHPTSFGGKAEDAFTVVAPSLPGYGLSFQPKQKRFGVEAMADCLATLMTEVLGYKRFAAQGGDWGAFISSRLGAVHAEKLLGIHINLLAVRRDPTMVSDPTEEERQYLGALTEFLREETGYQWIQGTRPQTLAFGLTDSPAGLAAWIAEKFRMWTDNDGTPETAVSRDRMLANISLYWFTGCIGSSFHPYYARMHGPWPIPGTIDVPMGYCQFPKEILRPPRSLAARTYTDIRRWTEMPRGGHFAAMEQTEALANEISAFFRALRTAQS
ncbi:MAG: epoxide hydrolase family protein [Alphaproteobacteria bacterium]